MFCIKTCTFFWWMMMINTVLLRTSTCFTHNTTPKEINVCNVIYIVYIILFVIVPFMLSWECTFFNVTTWPIKLYCLTYIIKITLCSGNNNGEKLHKLHFCISCTKIKCDVNAMALSQTNLFSFLYTPAFTINSHDELKLDLNKKATYLLRVHFTCLCKKYIYMRVCVFGFFIIPCKLNT